MRFRSGAAGRHGTTLGTGCALIPKRLFGGRLKLYVRVVRSPIMHHDLPLGTAIRGTVIAAVMPSSRRSVGLPLRKDPFGGNRLRPARLALGMSSPSLGEYISSTGGKVQRWI